IRVRIVSIPVLNQEKALKFYTEKLGFVKKHDIPMGNDARWLTVVSEEEEDGAEISLEPAPLHAKVFQKALFDAGIPWTQFNVDNVESEYERLNKLGVEFVMSPTEMGTVKVAVFHDTCGNNIQILEML
ncbi:UNVERIFIED_CONTAM: hypothetical protein GTU68_008421, partial [Idotea baltica]|nr:hypothetical protein [Idotea baltica]